MFKLLRLEKGKKPERVIQSTNRDNVEGTIKYCKRNDKAMRVEAEYIIINSI